MRMRRRHYVVSMVMYVGVSARTITARAHRVARALIQGRGVSLSSRTALVLIQGFGKYSS